MAPETTETATDWIMAENLGAWCRSVAGLVRQCFDDDDLAALQAALPSTDAEAGEWYEYPMRGDERLVLRVAREVEALGLGWMRAPTSIKEIRSRYGHALRSLVGKTIHRAWVVFDEENDDLHLSSPVVLELEGGCQLEVWNIYVTECGVTLNEVDLAKPPFAWEPNFRNDDRYAWLQFGHPVLAVRLPSAVTNIGLFSPHGLCDEVPAWFEGTPG